VALRLLATKHDADAQGSFNTQEVRSDPDGKFIIFLYRALGPLCSMLANANGRPMGVIPPVWPFALARRLRKKYDL